MKSSSQHLVDSKKSASRPMPSSSKRKRDKLIAKRQAERLALTTQHQTLKAKEREAAIASGEIIIADLSKQAPNNSYGPPMEYRDTPFTCCGCGREEVWTARQQQWWFEVAKGTIYGRAVRCRGCRRKHRESKRNAQLPKRRA